MLKSLVITLKAVLGGLIFLWLYRSDQLNFSLIISNFPSWHVVATIFFLLSCFSLLQCLRWHFLLKIQNIHINFLRTLQLYLVCQFFTSFLPGVAGGDVVRSYYISGEVPREKFAAFSTILADRVLGVCSLLWFAAISFLVFISTSDITLSSGLLRFGAGLVLISAVLFFLTIAFMSPAIRDMVYRLFPSRTSVQYLSEITAKYFQNWALLLWSLTASFLSSIFFIWVFWIIGKQLSNDLTWLGCVLSVPFIVISNMVPITPGGIGVGETTASFLFNIFNIPTGAETMLLLRIWLLVFRLPGGIIFLFIERKQKLKPHL